MTTTTTRDSNAVAEPVTTPSARGATPRGRRGYATGKADYLVRLNKIGGQVRGIQKMIEDDRWCPDVITQIAAVDRALKEIAVGLLNDHVECCVVGAARRSDDEGRQTLEEVAATIRQVVRL